MEQLLGAVAFCIKFGFAVLAICYGFRFMANFIFNFLTEEITNESTRKD